MVSKSCYHRDRRVRVSYRVPYWKPDIRALPPNHFLDEAVRPVIRKIARRLDILGLKVLCIDPVMMDNCPTILITSRRQKPQDFDFIIAPAIRSMVQTRRFYCIEFSAETPQVLSKRVLSFSTYLPVRLPGQSIGVAGIPWSAGTVGGLIQFDDPNMVNYCFAMSCHHILQPTRPPFQTGDSHVQKNSRHLNTIGLLHKAVPWKLKGTSRIVMPALFDRADQLEDLGLQRIALHNRIASAKHNYSKDKIRRPEDFKMTKIERKDDARLIQLQRRDCTFGKIAITSGYRIDPQTGGSIDWGLVRLPKNTAVGNTFIFPGEGWGGKLETIVIDVSEPIPGEEVGKIGCSTGFTTGVISSTVHCVDLDCNGVYTKEWAVVGHRNHPFSADGDSGSWVINKKSEVVGVIIGNNGVISYMSPMNAVIEDIQAVTGRKVVLHGAIGETWRIQGNKDKKWLPNFRRYREKTD
ncbi:hypothetical protein TWF730_004433 [Orbilia blumenaviensis]|uniref:Uncharacterized protein n=1 Tax=Orbilia blumenaviensis TaxID=1796055 RepID=A0AAV9TXV4_9PEZI